MKFSPEKINLKEPKAEEAPKGKLYIVSTPIGNPEDITLRALRTLKQADLIVCEEFKVGNALLHSNNLTKEIDKLNEQNEETKSIELVAKLLQGQRIALISDCGTPVFADPGATLVKASLKAGIDIEVVPGASSLLTAIVRSGFDITSFLFAGFVSRKTDERTFELEKLAQERRTVAILETPYRLKTFLMAAADVMPNRRAYIGMNLTSQFETHHYGTFLELREKFIDMKIKSEYVVCFEGNGQGSGNEAPYRRERDNYSRDDRGDGYRRDERYSRDKSGHGRRDGGRGGYKRDDNRKHRDDRGGRRDDNRYRKDDNYRREDRGGDDKQRDDRPRRDDREKRDDRNKFRKDKYPKRNNNDRKDKPRRKNRD